MPTVYHQAVGPIPQSEPLSPGQVKNHAGGYVYAVDKWQQLDRFLILGSEGGTYYASPQEHTRENVKAVMQCIQEDGREVVKRAVQVSVAGRAPRNDPAIFVMALCMAHMDHIPTRQEAARQLHRVCRTGSHLFQFLSYVTKLRGGGRALRNAVRAWYEATDLDRLALQMVKYRQRYGWTHRDALREFRPKTADPKRNALFRWAVRGEVDQPVPELLSGYLRAQDEADVRRLVSLIEQYRLSWEMIPDHHKNNPFVWEALLEHMPPWAMVRNLGKMTQVGLLGAMSHSERLVTGRLRDKDALRRARLHPLTILVGQSTYAQGHGVRGHLTWMPNQLIVNALDDAFYMAFDAVEPTGKRIVVGLDVSFSMSASLSGYPLSAAQAAAALAMTVVRTESQYTIMGFADQFRELRISPTMRLSTIMEYTAGMTFGGTDCALPMLWAGSNKVEADAFVVLTDNETWAGRVHPSEALRQYRRKFVPDARLAVYGLASTGFSIADPADPGMLDLVGFDTAGPTVMRDFLAGDL